MRYIQLEGEELVKKIIEGERDFRRVQLPCYTDLTKLDSYQELKDYLDYLKRMGRFTRSNPLDISYSSMESLIAQGLFIPYTRAKGANLRGADFCDANLDIAYFRGADLSNASFIDTFLFGANLRETNLEGADFDSACLERTKFERAYLKKAQFKFTILTEANLIEANLEGANFDNAYLWGANLEGANLKRVSFEGTSFKEANLRDVKNLETTRNIKYALFVNTKVGDVEKKILEEALKGVNRFVCIHD